ncbi:PAS domain S-box protein [Syntrophomonas palmitatica]|uniref:PAS domain S-box protein n=1 Tax=Syntrophomonas palmitatica TaxID=402877 RepID=UPI0006CFF4EF|nr:PAS domain S-box protein [Syntrophomonas palmitatica]
MFFNRLFDKQNLEILGFLADVVENSFNPFVAGRMDGSIIAFNQAFERLTGFAQHELLNLNIHFLTHRERQNDLLYPSSAEEASTLHRLKETEIICKDGTRVPINMRLQSMQFPGEELPIWIAFISDISDRKLFEQTLKYQLELQQILNAISARFANVNSLEIDEEIESALKIIGEFVDADRAYVFKIDPLEQTATNTHEWCREGIRPQKHNLNNVPVNEYQWGLTQLVNNDYIYIPCVNDMPLEAAYEKAQLLAEDIKSLLIVPLSQHNKLQGFVGFDQVRYERVWSPYEITILITVAEIIYHSLDNQAARYDLRVAMKLINNISEGLVVIEEGVVSWANRAFTFLTLYELNDVMGKKPSETVVKTISQALRTEIRQSLRKHGSWQGIIEVTRKDKATFPSLVLVSSISNNHNINRYCVVFADISEQMQLNQEKERLKEQTMTLQRLSSLSAMSAGLVHEIAQPLNSIKVMVEGMLYCRNNNYPLTLEEIFAHINDISFELGRIEEIIRHMRSFANLNDELVIEPCSWNDIICNSLRILGRQLAAHGIEIKLEFEQELPMMWGNSNRLDEVIINLLVNSMQALDLSKGDHKEILCRTRWSDKHSILEISDNAGGIPLELIDKIFEPFVTTKPSPQGMGLGLSVVHSIMNRLNGNIQVFNNQTGGATFVLQLPIVVSERI